MADILKNLWKNNNNNNDEDDHYYNVNNLSNFPLTIKDYKFKNRRIQMENELKKKLHSLYSEGKDILEIKRTPSNSNSMQIKYAFTDDYSKIILKGVEVNCRMITSNMVSQGGGGCGGGGYASSSSSSYDLSRIGNIVFKGELKSIIDELLEKSKKELTETYRQKITEIKTAAMYIPEHNDNLCGWECVRLEKNIPKTPEYSSFFNLEENNSNYNTRNKPLCYHKRQLIGQEIIPFVDDDDDNNDNDNGEGNFISCKQNEHVFDNLFSMKNELCGIKKHHIRFTPNFFKYC